MYEFAASRRRTGALLSIFLLLAGIPFGAAQSASEEFMAGAIGQMWEHWQAGFQGILDRKPDKTEEAFGALLAMNPSPLRLALFEERTVRRGLLAGAILLLDQDAQAGALRENGKKIAELLSVGREQLKQADDGWYFASVGRFDVSQANFTALLDADPDPVALLEFAEQTKVRKQILNQLVSNPVVGESARRIHVLFERGEQAIKSDPLRIRTHLDRLGGTPREFEDSTDQLARSGQYAVPFIVQYLRDGSKASLTQPILRALPQISRAALNPLVAALAMNDQATKRYLIEAIGQIGYPQAVPYLLKLLKDANTPNEVRVACDRALGEIRRRGSDLIRSSSAAAAFFELAEAYYADDASLAADSRLETASVWYWRDDLLVDVIVPTAIFNEVMCMRCCEEALRLDPSAKPPLALWIAANFRRAAQLGDGQDRSRPEGFATPAFFAQSAGAEYCLMALDRAVRDHDPVVALGTIEALRNTAGPAALVEGPGGKPLADALSFPDRLVRIRAALTLGRSNPTQVFPNYQNLMPVLSEALQLLGGARNALLIDPQPGEGNPMAAALRADGFDVLIDAGVHSGLQKARTSLPALDLILIASDVRDPGLAEAVGTIRAEFRFAMTPIVVLAKAGTADLARDVVRAGTHIAQIGTGADADEFRKLVSFLSSGAGMTTITPELGTHLALDAAETLRLLAVTRNPVFNVADAQTALVAAVRSSDLTVRLAAADVLGYICNEASQSVIAEIALDAASPSDLRVKMFDALAQAARQCGNKLPTDATQRLLKFITDEKDMTIREAASRALGALNLPGDRAGELVRSQYRG